MKLTLFAVTGTVIMLCFPALAGDMPSMKMGGMQMRQETEQAPVARAEGAIKAIDATKHTVTISHGAVPAVQWPPMTMAFFITDDQLTGLTTGDRVSFTFWLKDGKATIASIKK